MAVTSSSRIGRSASSRLEVKSSRLQSLRTLM
uniref:Uncharacterized protein n=1 Tax=Arundo donax TaxID=35708 RepID=A0A0A9EXD0_ARUDO